jgi:hypothetical protein
MFSNQLISSVQDMQLHAEEKNWDPLKVVPGEHILKFFSFSSFSLD